MPQNRVAMRKIREILRLAWLCGQIRQAIAATCDIGRTTVTDTLCRASASGCLGPCLPTLTMSGWKACSIRSIPVT